MSVKISTLYRKKKRMFFPVDIMNLQIETASQSSFTRNWDLGAFIYHLALRK